MKSIASTYQEIQNAQACKKSPVHMIKGFLNVQSA